MLGLLPFVFFAFNPFSHMGEKSKRYADYAYYLRKLLNDTNTLDS